MSLLATSYRPLRHAARRGIPHTHLQLETLESRILLTCDPILINQHVDLEIEYKGGELAMGVHDEDTGGTCGSLETILYVGPSARTAVPPGWSFLGAAGTYWRLTQTRLDPALLVLGAASDEIEPGQFDSYRPPDPRVTSADEWIKVTLRELYGPGNVSVWREGQAPTQWWISSFDGGRTYDPAFYIPPGAHIDYNWGFSAAGLYIVGFEATAFQDGSGLPLRSATTYYLFYVDDGGDQPQGRSEFGDPFLLAVLTPTAPAVGPAMLAARPVAAQLSGLPEELRSPIDQEPSVPQIATTTPRADVLNGAILDVVFAELAHAIS